MVCGFHLSSCCHPEGNEGSVLKPKVKVGGMYQRIYAVVKKIPKGRVATYGQVADLAGLHGQPRQVGYALNSLRGIGDIPWHRVINAKGAISRRSQPGCEKIQRNLLEQEGVEFGLNGQVELTRFLWRPRGWRS